MEIIHRPQTVPDLTVAREVVLGVGMEPLSKYCNHFAATPLDAEFAPAKWLPLRQRPAAVPLIPGFREGSGGDDLIEDLSHRQPGR